MDGAAWTDTQREWPVGRAGVLALDQRQPAEDPKVWLVLLARDSRRFDPATILLSFSKGAK